jgi:hypothetical protein
MRTKIFLSIAGAILLCTSAMAQSGTSGTLTWALANDGTLTIGGTGVIVQNSPWVVHKDKIKSIVIGDGITGFGMTIFANYDALTSVFIGRGFKDMIACFPFDGCSNLESLVVDEANPWWATENGMLMDKAKTEIWDYAKGRKGPVTIPPTVTIIGNYAFDLSKVTSVTIPSNVREIQNSVFSGCYSLESVIMEEGLLSIGENAFGGCAKLTSIDFPNSLTTIGESAFGGCINLTSIVIPENVSCIGLRAFSRWGMKNISVNKANMHFTSEDNILFNKNKNKLVMYLNSEQTAYTIPSSVDRIGDFAFEESPLISVVIPKNVTSIGLNAFNGMSSLTTIAVDKENACYTSEDGVLFNKDKSILIKYPIQNRKENDYIIPSSVKSIDTCAFQDCHTLTSITIPNSVTTIGPAAFNGSNLNSIHIPQSVNSIGIMAFGYCRELNTVMVDWSVSLNTNEEGYFDETEVIRYFSYFKYPIFYGVNTSNIHLIVPAGTIDTYKSAPVWRTFGTITEKQTMIATNEPSGVSSPGRIKFSLAIPTDALIQTGAFSLTLPEGVAVDTKATVLAESIAAEHTLSIENNAGKWLFTVKPKATRSATATATYQNLLDIVYIVSPLVSEQTYKADISDLSFTFSDGTNIEEAEIPVVITVNHSYMSSVHSVLSTTEVYISDDALYLNTPISEIINVYSFGGALLYQGTKKEGKIRIPLHRIQYRILIVKGSSGWVKKIIAN